MKERLTKNKNQEGSFMVEFAIVGIAFSLLILFSIDSIIKVSIKGKLDRMSYSATTVLKDRVEFYDESQRLTRSQVRQIYKIVAKSLARTHGAFELDKLGLIAEKVKFESNVQYDAFEFGTGCDISQQLTEFEDLSVVTSWGRMAPLYRVTICYETDNSFGSVVGGDWAMVSSSSLVIGR